MTKIDTRKEFFSAIAAGNLEAVERLSNEENLNATDSKGRTALMYAVIFEKLEIVGYLLSQAINLAAKDKEGKSVLSYARQNSSLSIIEDAYRKIYRTLVSAIQEGNESIFVAHIGDIYARQTDEEGRTLLMHAAKYGRLNIARKLRELGADFLARDNDGKSVLDHAYMGEYQLNIDTISYIINEISKLTQVSPLPPVKFSLVGFEVPAEIGNSVLAAGRADENPIAKPQVTIPRSPTPNTVIAGTSELDVPEVRGIKNRTLLERAQSSAAKRARC